MRVVWSPDALADVGRIHDYVSLLNPAAARRLALRLLDVADDLGRFPLRGRAVADGSRELTAARPYVIVYKVREDEVNIPRVWHRAQER